MRSLDLFSGIGGFTVAMHPFGVRPVLYCDIEQQSRDALTRLMQRHKLPKAPIHDDIRTLENPPQADMVCAGFPCLGFSPLGSRQGLENPQSRLVHDVIRLSKACGASIVFLENHVSLVQKQYADDFRTILDEFKKAGFGHARYICMHGHDVGCPQTRQRVYMLLTKTTSLPQLTYAPGKRFSWKTMPCPMSLERSTAYRVKLLGNSVIPDLTRLAFLALWTGCEHTDLSKQGTLPFNPTISTRPQRGGRVGLYVDGSVHLFAKPEFPHRPIPTITADPALYPRPPQHKATSPLLTQPVSRKGFPTLTTYQSTGCHVLTQRSAKHLVSVLRFIKETPDSVRRGHPNMNFYEWLMGYPKDWTL